MTKTIAHIDAILSTAELAAMKRRDADTERNDVLRGLPAIAHAAGVHVSTMRRWTRDKQVPVKRIGGVYIASRKNIMAAMGLQ